MCLSHLANLFCVGVVMIIIVQNKHSCVQNDGVSIFGKKICILI